MLSDGSKIPLKEIKNKIIYNDQINKKSIQPLYNAYWINKYQLQITEIKSCFTFIYNEIYDNKIKVFRWKLLNKILPNKVLLYKWKITTDPLCNYCNEIEDEYHYFITCKFFRQFREEIKIFSLRWELKMKFLF